MSKQLREDLALENKDFNIDRLVRITLIAAVTFWSVQLIWPFLGLLTWAFILAVALYPAYSWLNIRFGHRPVLAATIITLLSLLLVVSTVSILTNNMIATLSELTNLVRAGKLIIPPPPDSVERWPFIGEKLYQAWLLGSSNLGELINKYASYFVNASSFMLTKFADKSIHFIVFIFSVVLSGYFLIRSADLMTLLRAFANRIAFKHGSNFVNIINETIKNVAIGIVGIALFQSLLFGLLLLIAGLPGAGLVSLIALLMCIAQIGLFILIIPVAFWLFFTKSATVALVYLVLLSLIGLADAFLKPYVLGRGLRTPMIVILFGVLGGILLHGLIGVFIGPVILAVSYNLLQYWLRNKPTDH